MAVLKVKVVSMIGRMTELDQVTSICGESGIFHPDNALSFYSDSVDFSPINEENPYSEPLQKLNDSMSGAKKRLQLLSAEESAKLEFSDEELNSYVRYFTSSLNELQSRRAQAQQSIQSYTQSINQISHFVGLNINLSEIHACEYIKVRFGSLPKESYEKLNSYSENPYVIFFPSTSDATHYWGVYFSPIDMVSEVDRIFSSLYFERTRLTGLRESPEKEVEDIRKHREEVINLIQKIDEEISQFWNKEKSACQKIYTKLSEKAVYFGIRRYAARYNDNFVLTGWIPASDEKVFQEKLDQFESVEYTFEGAEEELIHSPPVKLRNKKPFKPFEFFVDMYGLPSYDEVDPTPFVAITYFLLFGIMFGDFGQGLVVSLIGWWMWNKKKMALGRILIPCGISSAIFGIVFGSAFGFENAFDAFYKALGFTEKPIEVMKPTTTDAIIKSAVGIGVVLVLVAIIISIYSSIKRKHYGNALFGPNGVAGFVFYGSLIVAFGDMIFHWGIVNTPYIICFMVVPIFLMFFKDILGDLVEHKPNWKPEHWGDYIMQNFFEVFEYLLSYATNTMSFLRVGAFVLVHAGMMLVVFTLAEMTSGVGYLLVVIIGNVFVMALEGLLVGIQVLRLEFYEMFSRFFDGNGRPFNPVTVRREQITE